MLTLLHRFLSKPLARQLRQPDGIFGRITARMMNNTNASMMKQTLETLASKSSDIVLEIGFGGGDSLAALLHNTDSGNIHGLELSETMLQAAKKRFANELQSGKLKLHKASIENMPFNEQFFDRICTMNTLYFWQEPKQACAELYRVCKPTGSLVIAFRPRDDIKDMDFTRHGFNLYDNEQVIALLQDAGFQDTKIKHYDSDGIGFTCVRASRN